MARPKEHGERRQVNVRVTPELHERLIAAAHERDVPLNGLCVDLLEEGLDRG